MLFRIFFAVVVFFAQADPVLIVEKTCYRRIVTGKRLHERYIRHSLPCNTLEACQHQCSIEKYFDCQGFNIRLDPDKVGRGICELSSVATIYLDITRDFVFDAEFAYYERDRSNVSPNCGPINQVPNVVFQRNPAENTIGYQTPISGGPYYGGDSYGPWSTGHGTAEDHGPWGSHGYGSGFYESNNPSRGPSPPFHPNAPFRPDSYGHGGREPFRDDRLKPPDYYGDRSRFPAWNQNPSPPRRPSGDRRYESPNRVPTYVIIDADVNGGSYGNDRRHLQPHRPGSNYLPPGPSVLPLPRPLPPPPRPPSPPPPPPPSLPPPPNYFPTGSQNKAYGLSYNTIGREVCFQRAHPGYKLNPSSIRGMYDMPTVLDCEAACTKSPFRCTGYSFRYSSPNSGAPNCLLTDFASLSRENHLLPDRSCDVYFKMGTCLDLDRSGDAECFLKVASGKKMGPEKIAKRISVRGMSDCELACLNSEFFTCRSFTFRYGPGIIGEPIENCFLSDWPMASLTHSDLILAPGYEVYERGSFGHGCEWDVGRNHMAPNPSFLIGYPNLPQIHTKGQWSFDEVWRRFTVNGWPCRVGTECQLNPEGGFWSCEVQGGDRAQWDYCCKPKHSCGFSKGFHYPWCYVGETGPDQWRPCSEHYYPEFGNRYPYKPAQDHNLHPVDSYGPPRDVRPWNFGQEDFGPPSYWPISYFYLDPPPNETITEDPVEIHPHHHHHHHYHYYEEEDHPEHFPQVYEQVDESPIIKFKPCNHKIPYPRAIIQKLDLKNTPTAGDPGEQIRMEEKPGHLKEQDSLHQSPNTETLEFSSNDNSQDNSKNELELFSSTMMTLRADNKTEEFLSSKRDLNKNPGSNATHSGSTKNKQIIETVEKIIRQSSTEPSTELSRDKNETLSRVEAKHSGFLTLSELEKTYFATSIWN